MVKADQQERGERCQLPEDKQRNQIVGQHQTQHRGHEHQHETEEPALVLVAAQIAARIDDDEGADTANQQRKQQAKAINEE